MGLPRTLLNCIAGIIPLLLLLNSACPVSADNPVVQTIYTADPAPLVFNNRVYLFTGHDEDGSTTFNMRDWHLYSSADMANWQDHGVMMNLATFSWASERAWAGQVIPRNNKFYYYVPVQKKSGSMAIGVAVSDNIAGPYKDALGKPLVENNEIDPTVYIDDGGQAYLYWGNPGLWYAKLCRCSSRLRDSGRVDRERIHALPRTKRVRGFTRETICGTSFTRQIAAQRIFATQLGRASRGRGRIVAWLWRQRARASRTILLSLISTVLRTFSTIMVRCPVGAGIRARCR
jgi:beta-xylosidase